MEEFLLRPDVPAEAMDVIDDQQIHMAIPEPELLHVAVLHRRDELIHEAVAGEVENPQVGLPFEHPLTYRLKQMGFAQPDPAVDEQRVVRLARLLGHGNAGRVGELIARPGDKLLEDIIRTQRKRLIAVVEKPAPAEAFAMKCHRNQPADDLLGRDRKRRLALPLAEVQLRHRRHDDLNHSIGDLAGNQLIEPHPMEARMLVTHLLQDALPHRRVK